MSDRALVFAALPRSMWASLAFAALNEIADLLDDMETEWDPNERDELELCARETATKTLPVLLEAYGDGPGDGHPSGPEVRELAEAAWERLGVWPDDRQLQAARDVVVGVLDG